MTGSPRLSIRELTLSDLRCHEKINWQCEDGINLLSGHNGSGKTTMLEAVYMMAHGRSFRQARDPELVRWGMDRFRISGVWTRYGPMHVDLIGRRGKSEIILQGKKISRRKELTETLPVVVEAPQAGKLVDGVPGERRKWLDSVIHASNPATYRAYQSYLRALMQRGRLIRRNRSSAELDAWEYQIVTAGQQVVKARCEMINSLNHSLENEHELMESTLKLELTSTAPESENLWLERLASRRDDDARLGRLQIGPHCDRLKILFGGREIRSVGSRGQQKLAAMALRLAECAVRQEYRNLAPLLLLDDCLEALDAERQQRLMNRLCAYRGQILMTVPSGIKIPENLAIHQSHLSDSVVNENGMCAIRPAIKIVAGREMEKAA
ncbi:MAG: DNA replication and repair protein RecF [Mariprofundaceae bacterium]|nr:DNA replication and repair protein RecF [Mariprofundaceae bacterium]